MSDKEELLRLKAHNDKNVASRGERDAKMRQLIEEKPETPHSRGDAEFKKQSTVTITVRQSGN